jgi:hypothetical protein
MRPRVACLALLLLALLATSCKHIPALDTRPLDQAGMWFEAIQQLRGLDITQAEVAQLARARESGVSDAGCIELIRTARSRNLPFAEGDAVASLRRGGMAEPAVLQLSKLNQLVSWSGEALAMRLAGMSDELVLAVAQRRAKGEPVMSGNSLARLKNTGFTDPQLLEMVQRGTTDAQAEQLIAARQRAAAPSGFVRRSRRR